MSVSNVTTAGRMPATAALSQTATATGQAQVSGAQAVGSNFAQTGMTDFNGGMSYPPGSEMASFVDNLNNSVTNAVRTPDGLSVVDWANNLIAQAQVRKQQEADAKAAADAQKAADGTASDAASADTSSVEGMMKTLQAMLAKTKPASKTDPASSDASAANQSNTSAATMQQMLKMLMTLFMTLMQKNIANQA